MTSLCRGHANVCIMPILVFVLLKQAPLIISCLNIAIIFLNTFFDSRPSAVGPLGLSIYATIALITLQFPKGPEEEFTLMTSVVPMNSLMSRTSKYGQLTISQDAFCRKLEETQLKLV